VTWPRPRRSRGSRACSPPAGRARPQPVGPIVHDEELLASHECVTSVSPWSALAGESREALRAAKAAVRIELEPLRPVLTIDEAIAGVTLSDRCGEWRGEMPRAAWRGPSTSSRGPFAPVVGTFYLETQAALAIPGESGQITIHSSTQNPSEVQDTLAHCLGLRHNQVSASARGWRRVWRKGVAGRPSRLLAALVAFRTGRPARIVYPRTWTCGSRASGIRICPLQSRLRLGTDEYALTLDLYADGGCAADLSLAVMERSMLHTDNAYSSPTRRLRDGLPHNLPSTPRCAASRTPGDRGDREHHRRDRGAPGPRCVPCTTEETATAAKGATHQLRPLVSNNTAPRPPRPPRRDGRVRTAPQCDRPVQCGLANPGPAAWHWTRSSSGSRSQDGRSTKETRWSTSIGTARSRSPTGGTEMAKDSTPRSASSSPMFRAADRGCAGDADLDREEQQHLADGRFGEHRPERDGGAPRLRDLESPARRDGRPTLRLTRRRIGALSGARPLRARGSGRPTQAPTPARLPELVHLAYEERVTWARGVLQDARG